jgi:hypothetical protein
MEPAVDQDRPRARVLDEERDDREPRGLAAEQAHRLEGGEPALLAVAVGLAPGAGAAQQRRDLDAGLGLPAG